MTDWVAEWATLWHHIVLYIFQENADFGNLKTAKCSEMDHRPIEIQDCKFLKKSNEWLDKYYFVTAYMFKYFSLVDLPLKNGLATEFPKFLPCYTFGDVEMSLEIFDLAFVSSISQRNTEVSSGLRNKRLTVSIYCLLL